MARILVVDDEPDLTWALRYSLSDEGYEVLIAQDGTEALAAVRQQRPDLIILDINMPGLNGLEVCRELRRDPALATVPILFLTVRDSLEDKVKGLDEGADDYLPKPFDLEELKARVRVLLRRAQLVSGPQLAQQEQLSMIEVGEVTLDLRGRQVHIGEKKIPLTPTQFDLLHHFMLNPNEVFSAEQLLEEVWDYASGEGQRGLVRWHIKNLREEIEPDPSNPVYIRTRHGHGYVFAADDEA